MPVGTVVARNLMDGITVLASDVKGTHSVEWGAKNDPSGDDIQFVPGEVVESVAFRRALARGVIEVMDDQSDPEVTEALSRQVEAFRRRQEGAQEQVEVTIDRPTSRDQVSAFCVGPDTRGTGKCGTPVAISEKKLKDTPPLCNLHKNLASQYVPEAVKGNEDRMEWVRVTLGTREG
jgi:hypothetical protein